MIVHAGAAHLVEYGQMILERFETDTRISLVFDSPPLYAFDLLATLERAGHVLIVADSASAPYLLDLIDLAPDGLLALPDTSCELKRYIERVAGGERLHLLPPLHDHDLTRLERSILHQLARGLDNAQIGRALNLGKKTVANRVSEVCDKLGVRGRTKAALFYLGISHRCS